jgi:flagellar basal-body rod protein FlgF
MNYGLQLAASGALTSLYRMDVLANNLANLGTTGFKPDLPAVRQRDVARVEDGLGFLPSNTLLERLGGGVMSAPNRISFEQGPLSQTGDPLDAAIEGEGFFVMRDETAKGPESLRLTRDGRFTRDTQGRLVSATTGMPVLDTSGRAIPLASDAPVLLHGDGTLSQKGQAVAQLRIATITDKSRLGKLGHGTFTVPADALKGRQPPAGQVKQGFTEGAAVDPISVLTAINDAARSAEGAYGLIQGHDHLLDRAINGLGRI